MPVRAPDDARPGTGRCFMSQTATGEKRRVFLIMSKISINERPPKQMFLYHLTKYSLFLGI